MLSLTHPMPESENRKPRRPLKNLPPDRLQPKVWLIWLAIVGAALTLLYWSPGAAVSPANITIEDVVESTQKGVIKSGIIRYDPSGGRDRAVVTGDTELLRSSRTIATSRRPHSRPRAA